MLKMIINGYRGRLGQAICGLLESDQYRCAAIVSAGIDAVTDVPSSSFPVYSNISECEMPADVIIDCSLPRVVPAVIDYALEHKTPLLICTTGLSDEIMAKIMESSKIIPIFKSANMSLGVNLLAHLIEKAVTVLYDAGFDIEIVEKHHNQKLDSPSGTALMLADAANNAAGGVYENVYGRKPEDYKKRGKNELGIHSVRGGTIIGEHEIIFAGNDEVIELKHSAFSKNVFAQGAIKAARFLAGKDPGFYTMEDLMREV